MQDGTIIHLNIAPPIICPFCGESLSLEEQDRIDKKLNNSETVRVKHCKKTLFSVAVNYDSTYYVFIP